MVNYIVFSSIKIPYLKIEKINHCVLVQDYGEHVIEIGKHGAKATALAFTKDEYWKNLTDKHIIVLMNDVKFQRKKRNRLSPNQILSSIISILHTTIWFPLKLNFNWVDCCQIVKCFIGISAWTTITPYLL